MPSPESTMGERLKAYRLAAGMSQMDVAHQSRIDLPKPMWIDQSKVSRLEAGKVSEEEAEPFEIAYLASLYGRQTSEVSALADEGMESVRQLVRRGAWLSR